MQLLLKRGQKSGGCRPGELGGEPLYSRATLGDLG